MTAQPSLKSDCSLNFLLEVQQYCQQEIAPIAQGLDQSPEALGQALLGLGQKRWLALRLPAAWGGLGLDALAFHHFQILLARHSGALCFLQTQHQGAAMQIFKSFNQSLKEEYLPYLARGKKLLGVGFSHLRRPGEPLLQALTVAGGYELRGIIPWVTGGGIFEEFILGATLPTGETVYGVAPLRNIFQNERGCLRVSEPLPLAVMGSTRTVSVTFDHWFLSADRVVALQPSGAIHEQDSQNVLNHGFLALGCAWAGLDVLATAAQKKPLPSLQKAWQLWQSRLDALEEKMLLDSQATYEQKLQWRSQAITLAVKCTHAAVIASSGAANLIDHPAQRVYREALMFSVSGQTTAVMEATLEALSL